MSQKCKCAKKLVLLKTFYFTAKTQDNKYDGNFVEFITNPPATNSPSYGSSYSFILSLTDKNYNHIKDEFIVYQNIRILANNPISGINKKTHQDNFMIKTKCGFVSGNTFYLDNGLRISEPIIDFAVTASSGNLKNAVKVTIEFDYDKTIFTYGGLGRVRVYGYDCK
jgi:hypothetical protein